MRTRTISTPLSLASGSLRTIEHNSVPLPPSPLNAQTSNILQTSPAWSSSTEAEGDSVETITDELLQKKTEGYCKHTRSTIKFYGSNPMLKGWKLWTNVPAHYQEVQFTGDYIGYVYMKPRVALLRPTVQISAWDWAELSFQALKAMSPKFSDLSLANDVLELSQIRDLVRPFGHVQKILGRNYSSYFSRASNLLLWEKFGIEPTIRSLVGVVQLLRDLPTAIADLRRRANRLQTRHFARPMDIGGTFPADGVVYTDAFQPQSIQTLIRQCRWSHSPVYHSTLKFKYAIASLTDVEVMLRAWLEATGLNNPLSVVYNAIPFSFVVDWFVNIGDWVESLLQTPAIPIVIEDFSHSVKYSYRTDISFSWGSGAIIIPLATGEVSYYERRRDVPATVSRVEFVPTSDSSVLLGTALIGQATAFRKEFRPRRPPPPRWIGRKIRWFPR